MRRLYHNVAENGRILLSWRERERVYLPQNTERDQSEDKDQE